MGEDAPDKIPVGVVAIIIRRSTVRARQMIDEGRFGPVERGPYRIRLVSRAAVEAVARERERRRGAER